MLNIKNAQANKLNGASCILFYVPPVGPGKRQSAKQTLYGSIFCEINTKEHHRIVKSDAKGKFGSAEMTAVGKPEEISKKIFFRLAFSRAWVYFP